jgi:hypothetical protein
MAKRSNAAKDEKEQWESEETEQLDQEYEDRTLALRKEPLSRKVHLMNSGVKEIRCVCCMRVRPIAGAEELGEGWVCEDCLSEPAQAAQR